jgi:hypothetical protein
MGRGCFWRAVAQSAKAGRARHFLNNSPISRLEKIDGECSSKKVISPRECAPQLREYVTDVFPAILRGTFFADRADPSKTVADHRPGWPMITGPIGWRSNKQPRIRHSTRLKRRHVTTDAVRRHVATQLPVLPVTGRAIAQGAALHPIATPACPASTRTYTDRFDEAT